MSVPALCENCGYRFTSRMFHFENATDVTLTGCSESCPRCGGRANLQDGTYDFIGHVLTAIRAPGVMREDVMAFRDIAQAVQKGELLSDDAATQVAEINSAFAILWKWMNENGAAIAVVLTIIAIYIAIWAKEGADEGSALAHQDVQQQIKVHEKIYEALQQQHAPAPSPAAGSSPKQMTPQLSPAQRPAQAAPRNRKERRAAAARARHQSPS